MRAIPPRAEAQPPRSFTEARARLCELADRWRESEASDPHAWYDAELEYVDDMLVETARALVAFAEDVLA